MHAHLSAHAPGLFTTTTTINNGPSGPTITTTTIATPASNLQPSASLYSGAYSYTGVLPDRPVRPPTPPLAAAAIAEEETKEEVPHVFRCPGASISDHARNVIEEWGVIYDHAQTNKAVIGVFIYWCKT